MPVYGCLVFGFTICLFAVTAKMILSFALWMEWQPVHPTESWPPVASAESGRAARTASARPLTSDMRTPCVGERRKRPGLYGNSCTVRLDDQQGPGHGLNHDRGTIGGGGPRPPRNPENLATVARAIRNFASGRRVSPAQPI